jgi:hypothetical protein
MGMLSPTRRPTIPCHWKPLGVRCFQHHYRCLASLRLRLGDALARVLARLADCINCIAGSGLTGRINSNWRLAAAHNALALHGRDFQNQAGGNVLGPEKPGRQSKGMLAVFAASMPDDERLQIRCGGRRCPCPPAIQFLQQCILAWVIAKVTSNIAFFLGGVLCGALLPAQRCSQCSTGCHNGASCLPSGGHSCRGNHDHSCRYHLPRTAWLRS